MSVNRQGGQAEDMSTDAFDDIITQRITVSETLDAANISNDPGSIGNYQGTDYEVIGENYWNEVPAGKEVVAELVAVGIMADNLTPAGEQTPNAPGTVVFTHNFGIQPGREGTVTTVKEGDVDLDGDGTRELKSVKNQNAPNHRFIYEATLSNDNHFNDTTNGTGGGGNQNDMQSPYFIPYRDWFGRGPLATEEDELTQNGQWFAYDKTEQDMRHTFQAHLFWDTWERDKAPLTDIFETRG